MTLSGVVRESGGRLILSGKVSLPDIVLSQYKAGSKLEWDNVARVAKPLTPEEASAYSKLYQKIVQTEELTFQVTGRLQKDEGGSFSLDVKGFTEPEVIPC